MNDVDDITKGHSDYLHQMVYYKREDRKGQNRERSQTGNPRLVVDVHSFHSEAPFFVEDIFTSTLLNLGVRREWFRLTDAQLEDVKTEAARYDGIIGPMLAGVRAFAKSPSNGRIIKLDAKDKARIQLTLL